MTTTAPASAPALPAPASEHLTIPAAFGENVAAHPDRVALRTPGDGVSITWAEYAAHAETTAARLTALGVRRGDTVALLLTTRPEAAWVDAAAFHLGAIGLSLYVAGTPAAHAYVLDDAEARVLVTERRLAGLVPALRRACPKLEHVLGVDGAAAGVTPLEDVPAAPGFDLAAAAAAVRPDDPLTLMYTSGTTGAPKGANYTPRALATTGAALAAGRPGLQRLEIVAFIPFAHAGQRAMGHYRAILHGPTTTTFCADPTVLGAAIADARPTALFAPPAVWQRLAAGLHAAMASDTAARAAHRRALEQVRRRRAPELSPADVGALTAVRARLGLERMAEPVVSAAPAAPALLEDLHALGIPMINLYALTEVPPIAVSRPHPADIGTAGRPLPGVELRIGNGGEVLVRHPAVCSGYLRRPVQTATLIDREGWAHTGDVGMLDADGRLSLDGRRDERFVTTFGTNIDPVSIETAMKTESPLIAQACVIGDGRPHLVALLTADRTNGEPDAAAIAAAVERVNAQLPDTGRVQRFTVLEDVWAPGSDELTPTLKLRRRAVLARYEADIDALYQA